MAIHVYRYKLNDPTLAKLASEVPGTNTVGPLSPPVYLDITGDSANKLDLDDSMAARGYSFDSTDPTSTVQQAAQAALGTSGAGSTIYLLGEDGPEGEMGFPGIRGSDGSPGPQGSAGATGPAVFLLDEGQDGDLGPPGPQGPTGPQGSQGTTGDTGAQGPATFLLDEGQDGEMGFPGPQGVVGPSMVTRINANSGAAGADTTWQKLSANATANATTTNATVMTTTGVGAGTWDFRYMIRYQSGTATTGVKFAVDHGGTVTSFLANLRWVTTGANATTNAPSQNIPAGSVITEGASTRAKGTTLGPSLSVDTINVDMLAVIEGTLVVTASGSLTLAHGSENANSTQVMSDTLLILNKIG